MVNRVGDRCLPGRILLSKRTKFKKKIITLRNENSSWVTPVTHAINRVTKPNASVGGLNMVDFQLFFSVANILYNLLHNQGVKSVKYFEMW